MNRQPDTIIIIPAFNEGAGIGRLLEAINRLPVNLDIAVIDDGSTDDTAASAGKAGATVISFAFNLGYGAALQAGFKYAMRHNYLYLIYLDADMQHEPESIPLLLSEIRDSRSDIVIGSRFLGASGYKTSFIRRIGAVVLGEIASLAVRQKITDPTSGFRALSRRAFGFYSDAYPADFPDADVIIASYLSGFKIREVAVKMYPKESKKSMHSGLKPLYYIFKMSLSLLVIFTHSFGKNREEA